MVTAFNLIQPSKIIFGNGKIAEVPGLAKLYGNDVLLVTGAGSFLNSKHGEYLLNTFEMTGIRYHTVSINCEPTPAMIDQAVVRHLDKNIHLVVAIGGGSVLDAGKAIAAMLTTPGSVKDYLEGVGTKEHPGTKIPFIAMPTTSGTGSEATKNAVITEVGPLGFKKSLRHDRFVPDVAIVDPELTLHCPLPITIASGTDCMTQLVEAYLSDKAQPITDALALDALGKLKTALPRVWKWGEDLEARSGMSYAALLSGICLANAGLGVVHGFASSVGGLFNIPHGVLCGTLIAPANAINVQRLRETNNSSTALLKYAVLGKLFSNETGKSDDYYIDAFVNQLTEWTETMKISRLGAFGINEKEVDRLVAATDCKNNPVKLSANDLAEILRKRL